MRKFRALTAGILASAMAMSMTAGFASFAADGDTAPVSTSNIKKNEKDDGSVTYTISVMPSKGEDEKHKDNGDNVQHTYEAYQIFTANMVKEKPTDSDDKAKFAVTGWGIGINTAKLFETLSISDEDAESVKNDADASVDDKLKVVFKEAIDKYNASITDEAVAIKIAEAEEDGKSLTQAEVKAQALVTSAIDFADVLQNSQNEKKEKLFTNDNDMMQAFAKAVGKCLTEEVNATSAVNKDNGTVFDIEVDSAGYYIIKDTESSPKATNKDNEPTGAGKTRYILTPTNTINPTSKADYPTIDKNIVEGDKLVDYNTASVGDTIHYQLDSKVPNTTGYNKYFYIVNDKMDKGLTFQYEETKDADGYMTSKDVTVTIGGVPLTNQSPNKDDELTDKEFYVEPVYTYIDTNGKEDFHTDMNDDYGTLTETNIKIVIKNFIQYDKDDEIVIKYDAVLNENANIGSVGNPNVVDLEFSNNPNYEYDGTPGLPVNPNEPVGPENPINPETPDKPDEPNPEKPDPENPNAPKKPEPTGQTPEIEVITYTAGIELTKVDTSDTKKTLKGAKFKIEGDGVNWIIKNRTAYEPAENGTYYKLADGTFTTTAPNEDTLSKYNAENPNEKYAQVEKFDVEKVETGKTVIENLEVDENGVLKIYGLNAGTYYITETEAPAGYVPNTTPKKVTIDADRDEKGNMKISGKECTWIYNADGVIEAAEKKVTDEEGNEKGLGIYTFKVTNPKGVVLPGTGAFGSKLMYALGTIFTGAGMAYMVSKKKSKKEEE